MIESGIIRIIAVNSAIIAAIAIFRTLLVGRLPKRVLVIAWEIAMLRLLLPITVNLPILPAKSSPNVSHPAFSQTSDLTPDHYLHPYVPVETASEALAAVTPAENIAAERVPASENEKKAAAQFPWTALWAVGATAMGIYYLISYFYTVKKLKTSLPVENRYVKDWLFVYRLERKVSVRYSDRVNSPLTYGIFNPTIVLPKDLTCCDETRLGYILEHEFAHIRHFDAVKKPIAILVLCLNWFNPLVWVMHSMYNRDIELWCDECVLRRHGGLKVRSAYAMTLISMEELRGHSALVSAFRKNSVEERIVSIMKFKKTTFISAVAAVLLVAAITVTIFAVSINPVAKETDSSPIADEGKTDITTPDGEQTQTQPNNALTNGPENADNMSDAGKEITVDGQATYQQIHDVYKDGEHGWDYLTLNEGERVAVICDLRRTPTDEETENLSANGLFNGEHFYRTEKSIAVGTRVICLFTAPESGNYSFSLNYTGSENFSFTAGAYAENSGEPYKFGDIVLGESDFEGAEVTKIETMRTDTDGDSVAIVHLYVNSQNETFYRVMTDSQSTETCLPLSAEMAKRLGLDGMGLQSTVTLSYDEFANWLRSDADALHEGMQCYDENLGYVTLSDSIEEYNPEKEFMSEEEYYATVESFKGSVYASLIRVADKMPQTDVTLKISRLDIPDLMNFAPGDTVKITDVRNVQGVNAINNIDGSCHFEVGTYDIWYAFDGLDKTIDYRQPIEIGYIKNGQETELYTNREIKNSSVSYIPGPAVLSVNVVEEGDYTFYIRNAGDIALPLRYTRVVSYGQLYSDVPYLEVK